MMNEDEHYSWPPIIPITEDPEEVLSQATHELRHPITAIKGYAELMLNGMVDNQEAAEQILKLASNTEVVLNAVLDYLRERRKD